MTTETIVRCFTVRMSARSRSLVCPVDVFPFYLPDCPDPKPGGQTFNAIWDTGATNSVVTQKVAAALGLQAIGLPKVQTAGGDRVVNQYIVNLKCPNRLMFVGVHVTEGQIAGDRDVLIGMDIIGEGDFAVSQDAGATLFSYRHPAVEPIDFVKQVSSSSRSAPVRSGAVPGRNHPCPCGSGKKFKACCGR